MRRFKNSLDEAVVKSSGHGQVGTVLAPDHTWFLKGPVDMCKATIPSFLSLTTNEN